MTGRGNYNQIELEKLKYFLLTHPEGVSGIALADFIGVSHARAQRLLDVADQNGFLTCIDGTGRNTMIYAFQNAP